MSGRGPSALVPHGNIIGHPARSQDHVAVRV
jgi:hypothetical protein